MGVGVPYEDDGLRCLGIHACDNWAVGHPQGSGPHCVVVGGGAATDGLFLCCRLYV